MVRAFTNGAMGRRIDPSWGGPIELSLIPASAPRKRKVLVTRVTVRQIERDGWMDGYSYSLLI